MAARQNSKIRRAVRRRYAARKQVRQTDQGQQDMFPDTGRVCVATEVGVAKLREIRRMLNV